MNESITSLWYSKNESDWQVALDRYWAQVKDKLLVLENDMEVLNINEIKKLDKEGWYNFLYHKYFKWKYTAPNRLATTRNRFKRYVEEDRLDELYDIKEKLIAIDKKDISAALLTAKSIHGLGISGASGLLSLMYPQVFGTVDQFVVKALQEIQDLPERDALSKINPDAIDVKSGVLLIEIMQKKAKQNNECFSNKFWTPRKIDQVLWGYRSK